MFTGYTLDRRPEGTWEIEDVGKGSTGADQSLKAKVTRDQHL